MAKRYSQPQTGPIQLNPKWLAKGLSLVFAGNRLIYDRNSRPQTATLVGGPKLVVTPSGIATGFGSTYGTGTTDRIDGPVLPAPTSGWRSIVAHFNAKTTGGAGFARIFQPTSGSGADAGEALYFTGGGVLTYTKFATSTIGQWGTASAIGLGVHTSFGLSHNQSVVGFAPSLFVAGKSSALTEYSASSGNYGAGVATSFGNRASDGARGWDGTLGIILFFDGLLTVADHADLHANPWDVFAPVQRRIWVSAAGGGVTYTLTGDSTSLTLAGQDAVLIANRRLTADASALTLAGQDATLTVQRRLASDSMSLTLAGQDATLTYTPVSGATYTLSAASGSLTLEGQDATLTYSGNGTAGVGGFEYRIVPMVRHKTLLQRIRESRPVKVNPVKQKSRKKASVIEVRAAQLAIDDGSEAEFRSLMDQWRAQNPVTPEAAGVDQYALFMAQVALQIKQIEQDDEDAVLTLLLC